MSAPKFKKNDRVKVVIDGIEYKGHKYPKEELGTVQEDSSGGQLVKVKMDRTDQMVPFGNGSIDLL